MDKFENFVPYIWEKNKNTVLNNLNDIRILNILFDAKRYDLIINNLGSSKIKIDDNDKLILFLRVILICQSKEKLNILVQKCSKNISSFKVLIEIKLLLEFTDFELWKNNRIFIVLDSLINKNTNKAFINIPLALFEKYKKNLMNFKVFLIFKIYMILKLYILKICINSLFLLLIKKLNLKNNKIISIGKFPRLADMIDRLDPIIRSLKNKNGKSHRIIVAPFIGYPNSKLIEMYSKFFDFKTANGYLIRKFWSLFLKIGLLTNQIEFVSADYRSFRDIMIKKKSILFFEKKDILCFEKRLNEFNIDTDKSLILFGLRDMAYNKYYSSFENTNFNKTNRFDTSHRCPDIINYYDLFKQLKSKNYEVLRMGLKVSNDLDKNMKNYIYDYASFNRDDALDIYLFSKCEMLIAGDTGLFSGGAAFNKPSLITDLFLIRNNIYSTSKKKPNLFIPKLVFNKNSDKLLSFHELIHYNHFFTYESHCKKYGYKLIHNSSEEILNAFNELEKRIKGEYYETEEVKYLRKKFNDIYLPHQLGYNSTGVISEFFLKKYKDLL